MTEWRVYAAAFVLIIFTNVFELAWVRVTALAVEKVWRGTATVATAGAILVLAFIVLLCRFMNRNVSFLAGRRIERRLRTRIFRNAIGMSQDEMDGHRTGDLVSRIINDVSDIRLVLGSGFLQVANNVAAYIGTIAMMAWLVPRLAGAAIIPFLPLVFLAKRLTALTHLRSKRSQEALGSLSASVEETVGGIEVIKSYTAESWQFDRFREANDRHYEAELARTMPESLFVAMMGSVVWVGIAAILLAGGAFLPMADPSGVGDLATFIFLFARLVWPTVALGWIMNVIQRGLAASTRIEMFLESNEQRATSNEQRATSNEQRPTIHLRNVSFTYPTRTAPSVSGLDLTIRPGEWVGIVGPTAAGKTTLARLIAGLRSPTTGEVTIGGAKIGRLDDDARRGLVHLATQVPTLFSMTIADNLRLADGPDLSDVRLRAVVDDAAFRDDLDAMKEGLSTEIGERGLLLSGGQRQRLSLARAYLSDAQILVLDDILSAVDFRTELAILDGIARNRGGRTTLFITHRLLLLSRLDRVIVMEDGRVTADGPLADALEQSTWLRATFEADKLTASLEVENGSTTEDTEITEKDAEKEKRWRS